MKAIYNDQAHSHQEKQCTYKINIQACIYQHWTVLNDQALQVMSSQYNSQIQKKYYCKETSLLTVMIIHFDKNDTYILMRDILTINLRVERDVTFHHLLVVWWNIICQLFDGTEQVYHAKELEMIIFIHELLWYSQEYAYLQSFNNFMRKKW